MLSLIAIFSLSVVGAAVTGFDLGEIIRLALVCTVASVSGVFLLAPLRNVSRAAIPELIAKGIGVGIPAAALLHQLFLHSTLRPVGWVVPTFIALPRIVTHLKYLRESTVIDPPNQLVDLLAISTFALVAMMMNGWWFLIPTCLVLIGFLWLEPVNYFRRKSDITDDNRHSKFAILFGSLLIFSLVLARYLGGLNFFYFFQSFDQLFRSAMATGLHEWGANENIAAVGTPLRYHWVAEASVGLIAKLSGVATLQVVLRFGPFLFTCAASAALWSLAKRFQLSHVGMALAFGSIFWLGGVFQTLNLDTVRSPLAYALFFLFLGTLSDYQTSARRLKFFFQIALFCPLILLTDTPTGVVVCVTTVLISLSNGVLGRVAKRDAFLLALVGPLSLLFVRISILKTNSDFPYNPIFGLNNILQFGNGLYDIYWGQYRWSIALASLAVISVWSFRWVGLFGFQNFKRLLQVPYITCLAPAIAGLFLANVVSMGASIGAAYQNQFLIGLVVLPLLSTDAISRDFAHERHQFGFWLPVVLSGACIGFFLYYAFGLELSKSRSLALVSVMTVPIAILLTIRGIEWMSRHSDKRIHRQARLVRHGVQAAILVSLVASSSFYLFIGAKNLTKSVKDEHGYLGTTAQLECLTWIRENTPKQSIVISNLWRIPVPTQNSKYFLVSNQTERRVLIDGPFYVDLAMNDWVVDRLNRSEQFIDTPSTSLFNYMKSMNVSIVLVDFQFSKNRNLEPFATTVFMNAGCLVAELK
jgi:hypothetical protein